MSRKPICAGGTAWVSLPLPKDLYATLLTKADGDKHKLALALSAAVVALYAVNTPPANESPA